MDLIVQANMTGDWTPVTINSSRCNPKTTGTVRWCIQLVFILRPISAVPASAITQQLISLANDNPV